MLKVSRNLNLRVQFVHFQYDHIFFLRVLIFLFIYFCQFCSPAEENYIVRKELPLKDIWAQLMLFHEGTS